MEKRDKGEARTERREGCLLADQSIGKYRHRGESRRDIQEGGGETNKGEGIRER